MPILLRLGNPNEWFFLGTVTVAMDQCILIGVYSEGINAITPTTATFNNIQVNTGTPVIPMPSAFPLVQAPGVTPAAEGGYEVAPDMNVYPNPVSSGNQATVEIVGVTEGRVRISIFSMQGMLLKEHWIDSALNTTLNLDASEFPEGMYLVNMQTADKQSVSKKMIVLKH
ncbi:MAG: T9SS type A sorting domain-containing protein [Saprospiraceae bacterium]|nr:T9SS type A sorting domain-containing protein [Saprospiraceae bacterium]